MKMHLMEMQETFMCHGLKSCWICENSLQGNGRHTYCPLHSSFVCRNLHNEQKNGVKMLNHIILTYKLNFVNGLIH